MLVIHWMRSCSPGVTLAVTASALAFSRDAAASAEQASAAYHIHTITALFLVGERFELALQGVNLCNARQVPFDAPLVG